jgi:hypothetical protein
VSIGFAVAGECMEVDYEQVKLAAAAALSEAKSTGRNKCVFHPMSQVPFEAAS